MIETMTMSHPTMGTAAGIHLRPCRNGSQVEIYLGVYNGKTGRVVNVMGTRMMSDDRDGIGFEISRLLDRAQTAGWTFAT